MRKYTLRYRKRKIVFFFLLQKKNEMIKKFEPYFIFLEWNWYHFNSTNGNSLSPTQTNTLSQIFIAFSQNPENNERVK